MIQIQWTVGAEIAADGKLLSAESVQAAKIQAIEKLTEVFGGITVTEGYGCWRENPSSSDPVSESVLIFTALSLAPEKRLQARRFAEVLRALFSQTCVVVSVIKLESLDFQMKGK